MSENRIGILDTQTWKIVCDFFRSRKRTASDGDAFTTIGSAISGIPTLSFGIATEAVSGSVAGLGALAAGTRGDSSDSAGEERREVRTFLSWYADVSPDSRYFLRVRVHVTVDTAYNVDEKVVISIKDAQERRIEKAVLELLGAKLDIENGLAEYSLTKFQDSLENTDVYLVFPDGRRVRGVIDLSNSFQ